MKLFGRDRELAALGATLDVSVGGMKSVLVLRGEPGVGKSAILSTFAERAPSSVLVLRTEGVESEADLGYGGLQRLLNGRLPLSVDLPTPQQVALHTAFGLVDGPRPDRFHVGLATLTLLADAASESPVLCLIDDAHWLDRETLDALAFVARRLLADRVTLVFAVRDPMQVDSLRGFDELPVTGLADVDALELLGDLYSHRIEHHVALRIAAEAAGNPFILHELARTYDVDELNCRGVQPPPIAVETVLEERFVEQIERLPIETCTLLLILAADQRADGQLLKCAAAQLEIDLDALDPAETAGLVSVNGEAVTFRHPLVRSACYRTANPRARRQAHAVLASVVNPEHEIERHAWHLALASTGADEATALTLMAAARRAGNRGANRSQVELLARAAELTPDATERGRRHLHACGAATMVADRPRVTQLIDRARASIADPYLLAEVTHVEALAPVFDRRFGSAPRQLLRASEELDAFDRDKARAVALEAVFMIGVAEPLAAGLSQPELAKAIRRMPRRSEGAPTVVDLLLDGYATVILEGWGAGCGDLKEAIQRWPALELTPAAVHRHLGPPIWAAFSLWDYEALHRVVASDVAVTRPVRGLNPLRTALVYQARLEVALGKFNRAEVTAAEAADLSVMMDGENNWEPLLTAEAVAWKGGELEARSAIADLLDLASTQELGTAVHMAHLSTAVLANGTRNYGDAAVAAREIASNRISEFGSQGLIELAEALVRLGEREELIDVLAQIDERAAASGTSLARGLAARAHAMSSSGGDADDLFRHAIDLLSTTAAAPDHARALLVYGEWLRREKRRLEARQHLRDAHEQLTAMGAEAFAERARTELEATGEHVQRRDVLTAALTPQERQVAGLAREGHTNKEIASRLYISAATVDYHLRKVYRKLNVGSRRELVRTDLE